MILCAFTTGNLHLRSFYNNNNLNDLLVANPTPPMLLNPEFVNSTYPGYSEGNLCHCDNLLEGQTENALGFINGTHRRDLQSLYGC